MGKKYVLGMLIALAVFWPFRGVSMQPGEGGGEFISVCGVGSIICCWAGVPPLCEPTPCVKCDIYWIDTDGNSYYVKTIWDDDCCDPDPVPEV